MKLSGSQTTPTNMKTWFEWWERLSLCWRERSGWEQQISFLCNVLMSEVGLTNEVRCKFIHVGIYVLNLNISLLRAPRCWTTERCFCLCFLWRGGLLTSSATSASCRCSTRLSPHHHLPNWPALHYCLHEHCITMVITLTDTNTQHACLKRCIISPF